MPSDTAEISSPRPAAKVLVLRTCPKNMKTWNDFQWPTNGPVECPDWSPEPVCRNGLFGLLWGRGSIGYLSNAADAKWLVVEVDPATVVDLSGDKVKFPRGVVVFCGDRAGAIGYLNEHHHPGIVSIGALFSPALSLLRHVWEHAPYESHRKRNSDMSSALSFVIRTKLAFDKEDFFYIYKNFRPEYWIGESEELYHALAVREDHASAYQAFEHWKDRKPFIASEGRIYVGMKFRWEGKDVLCTSFAPDGLHVVACTYKKINSWSNGHFAGDGKPTGLFKITHEMIRKAKTAKRKAKATDSETVAALPVSNP